MTATNKEYDLIIVGAGPAGISACAAAREANLNYLCIERGLIANTIYRYPIGGTVFSTVNELEMRPDTLKPAREKPTREELLSYYIRFCLANNFNINTGETVLDIKESESGFLIRTSHDEYFAASVLVCVGAMAQPRRLNVPGEDLPHVAHLFVEPFPYVRKNTMVIGGGNSAGEAALFLADEGSRAHLAILQSDWENTDAKAGAIKHWVREPLERAIEEQRLTLIIIDRIEEITGDEVRLVTDSAQQMIVPAEAVWILIGSLPDLSLLKKVGVRIETTGDVESPLYNEETFETDVAGVFVAGHFTHARHIVEAIATPRRIMPHIVRAVAHRAQPA